MKINGSNHTPRAEAAAGKPQAPRSPATPAAPVPAGVSLSELASRLQSLEGDLSAPFDAARVGEIKQAIRDGQFKVNPEVVADRLIESMKELLSRKA